MERTFTLRPKHLMFRELSQRASVDLGRCFKHYVKAIQHFIQAIYWNVVGQTCPHR